MKPVLSPAVRIALLGTSVCFPGVEDNSCWKLAAHNYHLQSFKPSTPFSRQESITMYSTASHIYQHPRHLGPASPHSHPTTAMWDMRSLGVLESHFGITPVTLLDISRVYSFCSNAVNHSMTLFSSSRKDTLGPGTIPLGSLTVGRKSS